MKLHSILCLITGFTIVLNCFKSADSITCSYNTDTSTADCQNLGLKSIPSDLPLLTENLDISSNPLNLTADSFKNLTFLITLKMKNLNLRSKAVDSFTLKPLTKLEFLDMTGSKFDPGFLFYYPTDIKTLIIDSTNFEKPDLRTIKSLEKLSAKSCSLNDFPLCYAFAPLICVDLSDNSMDHLSVSAISKYCLLEKLLIKYPASGSELKSKDAQCRCVELAQWSYRYSLEGVTSKELECYKETEADCTIDFTDDIRARDDCTKRIHIITPFKHMLLAFVIAVALLLLLYVIYYRCIAPLLPSEANKPSTTPRPRRPLPKLPKPWPTFRFRFPATPPPDLPGEEIELEEEEEEEEDED